jgi:hypothetical protein
MATFGKWRWNKETKLFEPYDAPSPKEIHNVIDDTMVPLKHPISGKVYDSKTEFRKETKARGLIEIGTETLPDPNKRKDVDKGDRKQAVIDAYQLEKEDARRRKYGRSPVDRNYRDRKY